MPLALQGTSRDRKGFKDRYQYYRRAPGSGYINAATTYTSYRETTDPKKSSLSYNGKMWEQTSSRTNLVSTRVSFCSKGAKKKSTVNKLGFRPPTPFNAVYQEWYDNSNQGLIYSQSGSTLTVVGGQLPDNTAFPWNMQLWYNGSGAELPRLNDRNRAEVECLVKLKDMKVNFGEALAESRSTIRHLATTTRTLLKAYSYAKKGKWGKVLNELKINKRRRWSTKDPAGRWLEVQFGWTPLVSDIKGLYDLSQSQLRERAQLFSAERNLVEEYSGEPICARTSTMPEETSVLFYGTRGTSVKLYARVRDSDIANLTSLGLSDPAQVLWASVPFSFVVDWVLPVGSYLEALGAVKGLDFVSGTRTEFTNGQVDVSTGYLKSTDGVLFQKTGHVSTVARTTYAGFPFPLPYVKSPFSTSHLISALALIRTIAFKR